MCRKSFKIWLVIGLFSLVILCAMWELGWVASVFGWFFDRSSFEIRDGNYVAITAGWKHSLALRSDGSIIGRGYNGWGIADPSDGNDFVAIAAGTYHSLALKSDGSIVGWGQGFYGETDPPSGNDFVAIAAGSHHSLALKLDGSIVGWGSNRFGQMKVPSGNDFVAIAAGFFHCLALKSDGSIVSWGSTDAGPPDGKDFIAIAGGHGYSLGLKSDGSIIGWDYSPSDAHVPPKGNDFVAIAAGFSHALTLRSDGSIVGWGDNYRGAALPPSGNDFVAIAAGHSHSLALRLDGSVVGWGDKSCLVKPDLPPPEVKEEPGKKTRKDVAQAVEVDNVSSLESMKPLPKAIRLKVDDKLNIDLVYIEPGDFIMGKNSGLGKKLIARINPLDFNYPNDGPARNVKITKGFYIGKYKVTCRQFCYFLNAIDNPQDNVKLSRIAPIEVKDGVYLSKPDCENGPINVVHWEGAVAFCDWLRQQTGFTVRLPTEAEWEFAARGPEGRPNPWGDDGNVKCDFDRSTEYKKYPHIWSLAPVDAFPDNVTPDGVVGLIGNVGEWCSDFYGVRYLKNDVIDPQGPTEEDISDKSLNPYDQNYHVYRGWLFGRPRNFGDTVDDEGIYGLRIVVVIN